MIQEIDLPPTQFESGSPEGGSSGGSGSALGGILGALALAYTAYQGSRNQDKQNRANREAADLAWEREKEMWNMVNQYNSPESQMARYQQAGLNPNLMYSQGSSGNSTSQPHYTAPQQTYQFNAGEYLMQAIPQFQSIQMRAAQVDNIKAQTENTRSRTVNESLRSALLDIAGDKGRIDLMDQGDGRSLYQVQQESKTRKAVGEAGRQSAYLSQAVAKVMLMNQQIQLQKLEESYRRSNLTTQQIDQEQKRADLLFSKYRNELMSQGITTSDSPIWRLLVRAMSEAGVDAMGKVGSAGAAALDYLGGPNVKP